MSILVINAGSSSVKFSIYDDSGIKLILNKTIDRLSDVITGIRQIPAILKENNITDIKAIGHRVVHGGREFSNSILVDKEIFEKLKRLQPLAPLHQPYNVKAIEIFSELMPGVPQIACFDTAFHSGQPKINKMLPIPQQFYDEGILRYGFHGLSYEYISSVLPEHCGEKSYGKVIVAHLGNGSSMCAMMNGKSVASSMGFSTLDGLMMGTRTGSIDPGVLLYLMQEKNYSISELENLLYKESGLLGVAGIGSKDMRDIISSNEDSAKLAFEMFCQIAARNLASLAVCLGGVETVIFTAGIGENSATVRQNICKHLGWMGISLDKGLNDKNSSKISGTDSNIDVYIIPTNEELSIIKSVIELLSERRHT